MARTQAEWLVWLLDKIPDSWKDSDIPLAEAVWSGVAAVMENLGIAVERMQAETYRAQAEGIYLDEIGHEYGRSRRTSETDTDFRARILQETTRPRSSNLALEELLEEAFAFVISYVEVVDYYDIPERLDDAGTLDDGGTLDDWDAYGITSDDMQFHYHCKFVAVIYWLDAAEQTYVVDNFLGGNPLLPDWTIVNGMIDESKASGTYHPDPVER